jgi:hypothetical protein
MKSKLFLLLTLSTLVFGCKKDESSRKANFTITNKSSGVIKEVSIQVVLNLNQRIDAIKLTNLDINKSESRVIDLAALKIKQDGSYRATAVLADGSNLEVQQFSYFSNGVEFNTDGYAVDISNNGITVN